MYVSIKGLVSALALAGKKLEANENLNESEGSRCVRDAACEAISNLLMRLSDSPEDASEAELASALQFLALSASKESALATLRARVARKRKEA